MKKEVVWPIKKALNVILFSLGIFALISISALFLYEYIQKKRMCDDRFLLKKIVQTGPEKKVLSTQLLAKILDLSSDRPVNLYAFSSEKAEALLQDYMLIESASVSKVFPDTLYIDYTAKVPWFRLLDYSNAALDKKGRLIPLSPFYEPRVLCPIYLGLPPFGEEGIDWSVRLTGKKVELAYQLHDFFLSDERAKEFTLERLDVSRAYAKSCGKREIIVYLQQQKKILTQDSWRLGSHHWILRLPREEYEKRFYDFCELVPELIEENIAKGFEDSAKVYFDARIIDLRLDQMGFVR